MVLLSAKIQIVFFAETHCSWGGLSFKWLCQDALSRHFSGDAHFARGYLFRGWSSLLRAAVYALDSMEGIWVIISTLMRFQNWLKIGKIIWRFIADNEGGNQEQSILRPIFYRLEAWFKAFKDSLSGCYSDQNFIIRFFSITYIIKKCQAVTRKDYCREMFFFSSFLKGRTQDFLLLDDWGQRMFLWNEGIIHEKKIEIFSKIMYILLKKSNYKYLTVQFFVVI